VARATRAIAVAVESGAVGTFEAVVFADDPFLHSAGSSLEPGWPASARSRPALCVSPLASRARFPYGAYRREPRLRRGFSPNFPSLSVYFGDGRPARRGPWPARLRPAQVAERSLKLPRTDPKDGFHRVAP